ncbi:MAG: NAD-dependent succinate-semialdehyde dehydrogenase [Raineya sp.]
MASFFSINPFTQEVLGEFPTDNAAAIEQKLQIAEKAFEKWRKVPISERASLFLNLAGVLEREKETLARTITLEMGKVIKEARAEIEKCILLCHYYAKNAEIQLSPEVIFSNYSKSYVVFQPLGAVLAIMPWNFPFWQAMRFAVPALMAGNVGLLKHAPNVPQCAQLIERAFLKANFPEGVFQNVFAEVENIESIIAHRTVQAVTLTGSEKAGSAVASLAGKYLKKSVMELGGSDAFVVLEDADLPYTIKNARLSRMLNNGQSCIAAKRFIVLESVYEEFLEGLEESFAELCFANPLEEKSDYACLARPDLAEKLAMQVQQSVAMGAELITGDAKAHNTIFQPTILANVSPTMPVFVEETFGPVAAVIKVKNQQEAIDLANLSAYGLGASVWSRDTGRAEKIALELQVGTCSINTIVKSSPELPFGGIKNSGYGRELSMAGIREFVNWKTLNDA